MDVRVRFVKDETADDIEIIICAREKNEQVEELLSALSLNPSRLISAQTFSEEHDIKMDDIILVMRDGRYVTAKTVKGDHIIKDALARVAESLDPKWFVRTSQSEIINLKYLKRWEFVGGGIIRIQMENNIVCHTSRRYASQIRETLLKRRAQR